jgi:tripartite-type tricarboxylate transporter receptor subunit TctC
MVAARLAGSQVILTIVLYIQKTMVSRVFSPTNEPGDRMSHRRKCFACAALATALAIAANITGSVIAAAAGYPERPMRLLVPFAPGGGTDIVGRIIAQQMTSAFGQSVVVDNRPGAGGSLGEEMIARATPDGYTLGMVSGYGTNAAIYKLTYDQVTDVQAVISIGDSGMIVAFNPAAAVKSLKEFITYAKANPGKLNYSSSGTGAITHLATELLNLSAGIRTTHIPYKGTGPALTALLSNEVDFLFGSMPATSPHVKAGRLRGVAVTTKNRLATLPDLPPLSEAAPGYEAVITYGLLGPRGLPAEVVRRWNAAVNKAIQTPEMKARLANDGIEPVGGAPEIFHNVIKRDVEQWKRVVKDAKLSFTS